MFLIKGIPSDESLQVPTQKRLAKKKKLCRQHQSATKSGHIIHPFYLSPTANCLL
jgi:hypothetical protein